MAKIKPFWRIVLGFLILCVFVYNSSSMVMGGSSGGFIFSGALLAAYIFAAVKVPYDDPIRSMRDLMAEQISKSQTEEKPIDEDRVTQLEAEIAALHKKLAEIADQKKEE